MRACGPVLPTQPPAHLLAMGAPSSTGPEFLKQMFHRHNQETALGAAGLGLGGPEARRTVRLQEGWAEPAPVCSASVA